MHQRTNMDQPGDNRSGQNFGYQNNNPLNINSDIATNIQNNETPRLDAIPIPQDMPFSNINPTSFAQLSSNIMQPVGSATSLSANIYSHTLSQYGPAIVEQQQPDSPILRPQCITTPNIVSRPMGGIEINPEYNFVGLNDTRPVLPVSTSAVVATSASHNLLLSRPPTITTSTSTTSTTIPLTAAAAVLNINRTNEPARNELVYSPPPIESNEELVINPNSGRPMGPDGRIPKKQNEKTPIDEAETLLDLQTLYRSYEDKFKNEKHSRDRLDRDINSMIRNHRGQSIELDPAFCRMKDQKKRYESEMDRLEAELKKVDTKMFVKFNYRLLPRNEGNDPISNSNNSGKRQLAKMSTTTSHDNKSKDKNVDKKDILLAFKDTHTWCDVCDMHFNNLRELGKHYHTNDHKSRTRECAPWKSKAGRQEYDKNKTYQTMKSICSKLTNENDRNFSVNDIDRALNPNFEPKDPDMKARFVARERGRFDDDDPLFKVRGYDQIMPIMGFYCKLCNRALCDVLQFENHVISYEHTYSHLKSISMNPEAERRKRAEFLKSYQKEFPPVDDDDTIEQRRKDKRSTDDKRKDKSKEPQAAPRGYKKLTSSIVDDHEALQGLVAPARRPPSSLSNDETGKATANDRNKTNSDETESSPNKKRRYQTAVPEIQPISKNQATGALKRLKNQTQAASVPSNELSTKHTKTTSEIPEIDLESVTSLSDYIEESEDIDDEPIKEKNNNSKTNTKTSKKQAVQINNTVVLEPGDKDSPFPDLELSLCVNAHDEILKDKRLKQQCVVKLSYINLDDYKHMLMDSETKWSRIDQLMAKREKIQPSDVVTKTTTEPTFFSLDGQRIPVELDELTGNDKNGNGYEPFESMKPPASDTNVDKIEETSIVNASNGKSDELGKGDNASDEAKVVEQQAKDETKIVKNEVMFTDEESEEKEPVDVDNYMATLKEFFLDK